jgi:hypothetical protein
MKPKPKDDLPRSYRSLLSLIPESGVRKQVAALLSEARRVAALPKQERTKRREQATCELLAAADQSPTVRNILVTIVTDFPRKKKWLPCYSLASLVVGNLLVEGKLVYDSNVQAVYGMVESWFHADDLIKSELTGNAHVYAIAHQVIANLNTPFDWLRGAHPKVLLRECFDHLCKDPESYDGIIRLLGACSEEERATIAKWRRSKHPGPARVADILGCDPQAKQ